MTDSSSDSQLDSPAASGTATSGTAASVPATASNDAAPAAVTAGLIVDELIRLGMRDAVVCPGSRSAPLARALVLAATAGQVRLHVRIDERSAAFLALGLAAHTGRVTPIVTTSGTAVANLLPAMVEATYTGIPLLALTADRPASYAGTGANQTINQARFFEDASVVEYDLDGTRPVDAKVAATIRARIDRVVAAMGAAGGAAVGIGTSANTGAASGVNAAFAGMSTAFGPRAALGITGPAHLNVRFVEPLVPVDENPIAIPEGRPNGQPWTDIAGIADVVQSVARRAGGIAENNAGDIAGNNAGDIAGNNAGGIAGNIAGSGSGTHVVDISKRTLVIAGSNAQQLPALEDLPTIAEPNSYAPAVPVHPLAAGTFGQISPDQIIVVGRPTLHRGVAKLLANPNIDVTIVATANTDDYPDVTANARRVVRAIATTGEPEKQWLKICEAASELAVKAVRECISESIENGEPLTGLHVAAAMTDCLYTGDQVVLGASNSVRDASWAGLPFPGVDTYAGRGAAGIDGTVATAIGIALARDREHPDEIRPPRTIALMGDLTFQHDAGALAIGPDEPRPENLTIVVANDAGGGIFETLEAGAPALRRNFERIFGTPQDVDFSALCEAYGVQHVRVETLPELLAELHPDTDNEGIRVVEVATARDGRRQLHEKLLYKAEIDA